MPTASMQRTPKARFAGQYRLGQVWNLRLRVVERELIAERAGLGLDVATLDWEQLERENTRRLIIAMRDLWALGNELAYALAYHQRKAG